jgi:hypothetical protein
MWSLLLLLPLAVSACDRQPAPTQVEPAPTQVEDGPPTAPAIPSPEPQPSDLQQVQTIGEATDGRVLTALEHARHESMYRFTFRLEGDVVPSTEARLIDSGKALEVVLSGVREDRTGHRPLTREDGSPFGEPVEIHQGVVQSFGRQQLLDDSAVAYRIELTSPARFRLHALPNPTRVILDVELGPER